MGSIPSRVIPKTFKMVPWLYCLTVNIRKASTDKKIKNNLSDGNTEISKSDG